MVSKFNKLYNQLILETIAIRKQQLPERQQNYYNSKKWKLQQQYVKNYMQKVFNICKQLCYDYFQEYADYLDAIFQECNLIFSCSPATVDLYGELLPDGNIDFNLYPTLERAMINEDINKIKKIVTYQDIFLTIPHEMAHVIDIMLNGKPLTENDIHRQSWKQIYNMFLNYFNYKE